MGYHESVAGDLDRWQLDRMRSDRPLKIQHRSGKLWIVNSLAAQTCCRWMSTRACRASNWTRQAGPTVACSGSMAGCASNWRRQGRRALPSLAGVSRLLASFGVTGVTDATPDNGRFAMAQFARAAASGELLQAVRVMGDEDLPDSGCAQVQRAERKVMLDENALPEWDDTATPSLTPRTARAGRWPCTA